VLKRHSGGRLPSRLTPVRRGEIEANDIRCEPFDAPRFREALRTVRGLTIVPPEVFRPEMVRVCASAGVAVVFVPELPGTRASGATRWLAPNKALIQLSLRYKTDDHLWFTFFHEAGHILRHGKRDVFVEDGQVDDTHEHEADRFAADTLIPSRELARLFTAQHIPSRADISRFAAYVGVAPGIVVGRLQHDGVLQHSHCNQLKRRLRWAEADTEGA
jgi:hypothetical protein